MTGFLDLFTLMVVIWTAGRLFKSIRLPEVFGELIGGIIVGPAMLGLVRGDTEVIRVLSELGIFFLMVHTGLKMDPSDLAAASKKSLVIGIGSMAVPLAGGYAVAQLFGMDAMTSLFIGLCLSISALPLAARMLKDCKLDGTTLEHATLGAAIVVDVLGLVLFSLLIGAQGGDGIDWFALGVTMASVLLFFTGTVVGGIFLHKYLPLLVKHGNRSFTVTLILTLCIGLLAEAAGLHMVIGAFLAGLFIREEVLDKTVFTRIEDRYYGLTYGFFGPIFFASLAFHFEFSVFLEHPSLIVLLTLAAIVTKLVGSGFAALLTGFGKRESLIVGLALNTRGAVELVIASIGLAAGLIDETTFSVLITAAFAATLFSLGLAPVVARKIPLRAPDRDALSLHILSGKGD